MNSLSLPVVHPAFQRLKQSGRFMHLTAGGLILAHAISHFKEPHPSPFYLGCLLLMALDIFILVLAGKNILVDMPRVNLFFRLTEIVFFLGISLMLLFSKTWLMGTLHGMLGLAYGCLFYCEKKAHWGEVVSIFHSGVSIPALPESKFFLWTHINRIEAQYDHIVIDTSSSKSYRFDLQKNLAFEELDQIHEFCRHYLGTA